MKKDHVDDIPMKKENNDDEEELRIIETANNFSEENTRDKKSKG